MNRKTKFRKGQVVMVIEARADGASRYPVKLDHLTRIGRPEAGIAWMDTLNNVEYENRMRPLTVHERGPERKGQS